MGLARAKAGADFDVVEAKVYLTDINDYAKMNTAYRSTCQRAGAPVWPAVGRHREGRDHVVATGKAHSPHVAQSAG